MISDFGGVLTVPLAQAFEEFHRRSGISPERLGAAMAASAGELDGAHPLFELERGRISEERFIELLRAGLGPELGTAPELGTFKEIFFEALHPNEPMIELMASLRERGYRMALLTNNVREWEPLWRAKLDVEGIFELVVDSGFVGMRKPDPEIYELTVSRLDRIEAASCLFVDDVGANCEAAAAAGMTAIQHLTNERTIPAIEAALASG